MSSAAKRMKLGDEHSEAVGWKLWCRLCGSKDSSEYYNTFEKTDDDIDATVATEIGKYFWVKIRNNDKLPQRVCKECYILVTSLSTFNERVNKVQNMFCFLKNNSESVDDEDDLMHKFGLADDDWHHIIKRGNDCQDLNFEVAVDSHDFKLETDDEVCSTTNSQSADDFIRNETAINLKDNEELDSDNEYASVSHHDTEDEDIYLELRSTHDEDTIDGNSISSSYEIFEALEVSENEFEEMECEEANSSAKRRNQRDNAGDSKQQRESPETEAKYNCKKCFKKYKNLTFYRKHMIDAHSMEPDVPDFSCENCDKTFPTERQLDLHKRSHLPLEEKQVVPCEFCDKKFTMVSVMKQHVSAVHFNEKPYVCEQCGRALKSLAAFNDHKLTHSTETPFECEICLKKFKTKLRLKMHAEIHTEGAYTCNKCGLELSTKRTLKMHMLVHSDIKEHKCDFCGAEFKRSKALKNHLILHTGIRPYKCSFCSKTFSNGSNCRAHKKKIHPKELAEHEALGVKTRTEMPKIEELKSCSKAIKSPLPIRRVGGGLSKELRELLIAAENRKKMSDVMYEVIDHDLRTEDVGELDVGSTLVQNIPTIDSNEEEQGVIYEVINEIN